MSGFADDIGDQLCDRVLSVLLEVWLQACARCFPSPRLWKTLTELAQTWRHRAGLVAQWNRINIALTARLLASMYGPSFPSIPVCKFQFHVSFFFFKFHLPVKQMVEHV